MLKTDRRPLILVADDNENLHFLVTKARDHAGICCDISWVRDGDELIAYLEDVKLKKKAFPDILLLDLKMPGRSGQDVLREIKSQPQSASIRVIVWSNSAAEEIASICRGLEVEECFVKPSGFKEFIHILEKITAKPV